MSTFSSRSIKIGTPFPSDDPTRVYRDFLYSSGSPDMNVNGSVTPIIFSIDALPNNYLHLYEIRTIFVDRFIGFGENKFGELAALTNGVKYSIYYDSIETTLGNLQTNEDFLFLGPGPAAILDSTGLYDMVSVIQRFDQPIELRKGSSDAFRITIRDNLTGANYFRALAYGVRE